MKNLENHIPRQDKNGWYAVIVAGGTGQRFGGSVPKQFFNLNGKPVLLWSITTFFSVSGLIKAVIVSHKDWIQQTVELVEQTDFRKSISVVQGGCRRQDSCRLGLLELPVNSHAPVLIHDAARPWVSRNLVLRILNNVRGGHCVVPTIQSTDSIVTVSDGMVLEYPDRAGIGSVQTPQGFPLDQIRDSHLRIQELTSRSFTDDGSIMLNAGYPLIAVPGDSGNRKITHPDDLPES